MGINLKSSLEMKQGIPVRAENIGRLALSGFALADNSVQFSSQKQAYEMNDLLQKEENFAGVSAGMLLGVNLIIKVYRRIIRYALTQMTEQEQEELAGYLSFKVGKDEFEKIKDDLSRQFRVKGSEAPLEAIVIWLCNENPAFLPLRSLFSDNELKEKTDYLIAVDHLADFFQKQPPLLENYRLFDLLLLAARKHPFSIYDQLAFLRSAFGGLLDDILDSLLAGLDLLQEEQTLHGGGPGPTQLYDFSADFGEYERFSEDQSWMTNLVLIGKSTYVWLAQLSRKYKREIDHLDQIPDEELRTLAERGFNGLWLIGIWERSSASRRIKHLMGNSEAIASAYSLKNYRVAAELGGDEAMRILQRNAWKYGLRIGCDMVPNHMSIDSDWIAGHPEWFLQSDEPPFPAYRFHSQNVADRPEIEVVIEDHYYERTDAAVVFKLHEKHSGRSRYIYHGNDGTSIPWNDTAQLNYLLPEVREAVIRQIASIAKSFPVIRFDAAMTLAKRHIQRLWFPLPGKGGSIPSRSRFALTKREFDKLIPQEFWREVVDRVAAEAPDTLLLAEAFWMMEGYFVRTLGMHRVYNSAFMNMLKAEENAKYRESIKNVLAFNPQILKRFVNFMSNPDEDTAIAQFGTDDKYFGVCVLMAAMPGLPMFAHGQAEGFTERYGMEYARPKLWEDADMHLVSRHEKEIFPLLRKRKIFAEVDNFLLFDFRTIEGDLNENVFAFSNEAEGERSLVVFHNTFAETSGYLHKAFKPVPDGEKVGWQEVSLAEAWHLSGDDDHFTIFSDLISGLTYIRKSAELNQNGLYIKLGAFKYAVYWEVREIKDPTGDYSRLHELLGGKGTANLPRDLKRLELSFMLDAVQKLISPFFIRQLLLCWKYGSADFENLLLPELQDRMQKQTSELLTVLDTPSDPSYAGRICRNLTAVCRLEPARLDKKTAVALIIAHILEPFAGIWKKKFGADWFRQALLADEIESLAAQIEPELPAAEIVKLTGLIVELLYYWSPQPTSAWLPEVMKKTETKRFLAIHDFDGKTWFNRESYQIFIRLLKLLAPVQAKSKKQQTKWHKFILLLEQAESGCGYQTQKLGDLIAKDWKNGKNG